MCVGAFLVRLVTASRFYQKRTEREVLHKPLLCNRQGTVQTFPGTLCQLRACEACYLRKEIVMNQSLVKCSLIVALCVCMAGMFLIGARPAQAATAQAAHPAISCPGVQLTRGAYWNIGGNWSWTACSGRNLNLVYQTDGNFVLYCNNSPIWSTRTENEPLQTPDYTEFQPDGNLVVYGNDLNPYGPNPLPDWASNTNNQGAVYMQLQGDGNVVIYTAGYKKALWATGTSGRC